MKKYQLVSLLWLLSSLNGQNLVDLRTQTKNVDFSSAASTIPAKSGTTLPAACNPGEMFFNTANTPGQNLYTCSPANTWTQLAGGSGSGSGTVSTATAGQFGYYSASGSTIVGHTLTAGDIPALNYQSPLRFTGTGSKTASSTGSLTAGDCATWDPNGNIIDFGSPCASVASGTTGQFAFYSAAGSALTAHTLAASDIPALNYQAPLTFTGNGTKTASSIGSLTSNNCAKWDVNGNVVDSGSPCLSTTVGTVGQFAFYASTGSALTAHTLQSSDIPALNYQTPLTFTGNGPKTASSVGSVTSNDCAKWDVNGNVVDSGSPCLSTTVGTAGQFAFYASSGSALTAHTLQSSDIPALNYQTPLTFTGNGPKAASSVGSVASNDCAKWDVNGNVVDSGSPCLSATTGTAGQFAFYASSGSALTAHTLQSSDIPALNYQAPLTFTGNGSKAVSSTGSLTSNDCAKWDANGNVIDAGAACASVASGTAGQFAFYSSTGSALTAHTLAAGDIPALNYQAPLTFTGTGAKTASSTGAVTATHCAMWDANGNVVDAGAACGSGSGGGISAPSTTTVGNVPQFSNTSGTALSAGLGVVTTVGSPGADTNVPTEKSVRTAITAALTGSGNLPTQTGTAGYLTSNGSVASWGNIATGGSGALDCATVPGVCDIVTAIVPLKPASNSWTGANDFSGAAFLRVVTGTGIPATGCSTSSNVGSVYERSDTQTTGASLYVCSQTGSGTYSWENVQTSGTSPLPVFNAAGTAMSDHMVTGRNSFFSSTATVTLSGAAAFSSATSYACTANDLSSATAVMVTQTSGSSITFSITGGNATDNFSYNCVGN